MMRYIFIFIAAIQLAGCDDVRSLLEPGDASVPTTIDLHVGQTRWLPADGLLISFLGVPQDSRCPKDAVCVWEGDGAVALTIRHGGMATACTLHTTLMPKSVVIHNRSITLKRLTPDPYVAVPIDPSAYIATLVIDRAEPGR